MTERKQKKGKTKAVILILLILLLLSIGAMAVRMIYLYSQSGEGSSVVVPDNLIGTNPSDGPSAPTVPATEETAPARPSSPGETWPSTGDDQGNQQYALALALHKNQLTDNAAFEVGNLLPGDTLVQYYCLKASHRGEITVYFSAPITEQTKQLADVLHIQVSNLNTGRVVYDGTFAGIQNAQYMDSFGAPANGETVAYYKVQVMLPTSTGNAHQNAALKADFQWRAEEENLTPPSQTGDASDIHLWLLLLVSSAVMLLVLTRLGRKEADDV